MTLIGRCRRNNPNSTSAVRHRKHGHRQVRVMLGGGEGTAWGRGGSERGGRGGQEMQASEG